MSQKSSIAALAGAVLAVAAFASTTFVPEPTGVGDPTLPRPFRVYRSLELNDNVQLPLDYREQTEFVFARLMYPSHPYGLFSRARGYAEIADRDWRQGGVSWTPWATSYT